MAHGKVYSMSTEEAINVRDIQIEPPTNCTFVEDFFAANGHKKPEISLKIHDWDLNRSRDEAADQFEKQILTPTVAATYLYRLADSIVGTLDANWISYQVKIGSKHEDVTPLSICNFKVSETAKDGQAELTSNQTSADNWLALGICGYYRVALTTNSGNDDTTVINEIRKLMVDLGYKGHSSVQKFVSFSENNTLSALISAYDMFFCRFQDHDMAVIRAGTLESRYRDCPILESLSSLQRKLSINLSDLCSWAYVPVLKEEFIRIIESPDELHNIESYTPYLHGFRLVVKSPYSPQACINIYFWLNMVGICLFLSPKSINSPFIQGPELCADDVVKNAILFGFAYRQFSSIHDSDSETADEAKQLNVEEVDKSADRGLEATQDNMTPDA